MRARSQRSKASDTASRGMSVVPAPVTSADDVRDAVRSMSARHRAVLGELYFGRKSVEEAAATLKLSVEVVKERAYYAMRILRLALEERSQLARGPLPGVEHRRPMLRLVGPDEALSA